MPPQLAVWAPAGLPHRIEILTDAELWILHHRPLATEARAPALRLYRAFALRVTPLLRALLAAAFAADTAPEKTDLIVELMLHELTETADAPTFLPLPAGAGRAAGGRSGAGRPLQPAGRGRAGLARSYLRPYPSAACSRGRRGSPSRPGGSGRGSVHAMDRLARGDPVARGSGRLWLRQHRRLLLRLPPSDRHDADHLPGPAAGALTREERRPRRPPPVTPAVSVNVTQRARSTAFGLGLRGCVLQIEARLLEDVT